MSKSPDSSQKPKLFKVTEENNGSRRKRPALDIRRSLTMEDKVNNVCENPMTDKTLDEMTMLESDVETKKASVKVVISDSRLSVRMPQNGVASSLIKTSCSENGSLL